MDKIDRYSTSVNLNMSNRRGLVQVGLTGEAALDEARRARVAGTLPGAREA
jgi:hypothetical protein